MPVARTADELVAVVRLLVVMEFAEPGEPIEFCDAGGRPPVNVVDFEVLVGVAPRYDTFAVAYLQCGALVSRDARPRWATE